MKNFKTLGVYFSEYKWHFIVGVIMLVFTNIPQLFIPQVIKVAVDDITTGGITLAHLVRYAIWIVGLALIVAFFRFFWRYYILGTVRKIEEKLRNRLFSHLQLLGLNFFMNHKVGDLMAHSTNDIDAVTRALQSGITTIVDILVLGIFSLIFMWLISVKLTLYAIIPLPALTFIVLRFARLIHNRFEQVQQAFSSLTIQVRENIEGIRVVKSYNQEVGEVDRFKQKAQEYVDRNINLLKVGSAFHPLIFFFASIAHGILLWLGGKEAIFRNISMGDFVAFYSYLGMFIGPMVGIGMLTNLLQRGAASMSRINRLLDIEPEHFDASPDTHRDEIASLSLVMSSKMREINGEVEFINLSFSYNGTEVLKKINLHVKPGDSLGIAGEVGAGKTTLISLLLRLLEPTTGEIRLDNIPINKIPLSVLRKNISVAPQDTFLFSDTIKANISFAQPDAPDYEIHRVAKLVQIYDEIVKFPNGFDEIIGERGVTLSGGQRQRVAIARAILANPKILILDNALSSVDIEKEIEIIRNLQNEFADRVLIIISHRIRSLMTLDRIIVLEQGELVETGTHTELLKKRGSYFNLFRSQEIE